MSLFKPKNGDPVRDAVEGLMDEGNGQDPDSEILQHERTLISNILELHDLTAEDLMVPRADIVAVEMNASLQDLMALVTERGHSRLPVYRETLDDVVGMVHIKDVICCIAGGNEYDLSKLMREPLIISPAMRVLDLLRDMRQSRRQLALVVDEFGGVDGLVTIEDLIEGIVGEIEDEFDNDTSPTMRLQNDGTLMADARASIDDFELRYGPLFSDTERNEADTLGGLAFSLAGRVPTRGELLKHSSGIEFEIVEADPRRIKRLRLRNLPPEPPEG